MSNPQPPANAYELARQAPGEPIICPLLTPTGERLGVGILISNLDPHDPTKTITAVAGLSDEGAKIIAADIIAVIAEDHLRA